MIPGRNHLVDTREMLSMELGKWSSKASAGAITDKTTCESQWEAKEEVLQHWVVLWAADLTVLKETGKRSCGAHILPSRNLEILKLNRTEMEGIS